MCLAFSCLPCALCVQLVSHRAHSHSAILICAATKTLEQPANNSFFGGLREVLSFKPYLLLMGAFMGIGLGLQVPLSLSCECALPVRKLRT